jgi:hypothetical protein
MWKVLLLLLVGVVVFLPVVYAQQSTNIPRIEACDCLVKVDSSFGTRCGYLVVPENRAKRNGKRYEKTTGAGRADHWAGIM